MLGPSYQSSNLNPNPKLVLGIESSCDETAVAILECSPGRTKVLVSLVSSQVSIHSIYGGVIPEIAAREHLKSIYPLFREALHKTNLSLTDIQLIAVTQGPGLIGALQIGVTFAKAFGFAHNIPVIPVDHVHAHVHGALLGVAKPIEFPAVALVVSGGHTNLYFMKSPTHFQLLTATKDDACGECFDKVGKMLDISYPGGPQIERLARQGRKGAYTMPKIMVDQPEAGFSYSGLKTHVYYLVKKEMGQLSGESQDLPEQTKSDICLAFQEEAFQQIMRKLQFHLPTFQGQVKSLIIAGGVAANMRFREMIQLGIPHIPAYFPALTYCSDNAAMIASLGWYLYQDQKWEESQPWDAYSRYAFEASRES